MCGIGDGNEYGHSVGSCWVDFDNDGHFDLVVGNFSHPPASQDRCKFYRNHLTEEGCTFVAHPGEVVRWQESYAHPTFGDYDNDGFPDLYLTTIYPGDRSSLFRNTSARLNVHAGEEVVGLMADTWTMSDDTDVTGTGHSGSYQGSWADFDNDGDLDLATGGLLLRNPGSEGHHWLKVRLRGEGVNAFAIGAEVRIRAGRWILTRQVEGATGEGNQNDLTLHFGFGDYPGPVELQIKWPDGTRQTVPTSLDKSIEVVKDRGN